MKNNHSPINLETFTLLMKKSPLKLMRYIKISESFQLSVVAFLERCGLKNAAGNYGLLPLDIHGIVWIFVFNWMFVCTLRIWHSDYTPNINFV